MQRDIGRVIAPQSALNQMVDSGIQRAANQKALIAPCEVISQSGWFVSVRLLLDSDKAIPTIDNVPVLYSPMLYCPIKPGDRGLLLPADVFLTLAIDSGSDVDPDLTPGNIAAYTFLPLPKRGQVAIDAASVCLGDGTSPVKICGEGKTVDVAMLWAYLINFQTAYNANMSSLSLPTYTGTF